MIRILVTVLCLAVAATAFAGTHSATRDMTLDAVGLKALAVETGPGELHITGNESADAISVRATIGIKSDDPAFDMAAYIEEYIRLTLDRNGEDARFEARIADGWFDGVERAAVDVEITLPQRLDLEVDDGSGDLLVESIDGRVAVDDGSGNGTVRDVARLEVDDGSGDFTVDGVRDGCDIDDGSGDLAVRNVTGPCRIDDGSGELRVRTIRGKVTIDDGSGHLFVTDVEGDVRLDDGSGDIVVRGVTGEIEIEEAGSGDVRIDTDGTEGSR